MNSVRSPIAAALARRFFPGRLIVRSAGVRKTDLDPFAVSEMREIGLDIDEHRPMTFEELDEWEGGDRSHKRKRAPAPHHWTHRYCHQRVCLQHAPPDPPASDGGHDLMMMMMSVSEAMGEVGEQETGER